jgi:hypothetical protein
MKVWAGYGSEHSYRLVMIGHFADAAKARATMETFERLRDHVGAQLDAGTMDVGWNADGRMNDALRAALEELRLYDVTASEAENFAYDFDIRVTGDRITLTTDEGEVQGFLKVLLHGGARIEVYSATDWTDDREPRLADD